MPDDPDLADDLQVGHYTLSYCPGTRDKGEHGNLLSARYYEAGLFKI